MKSNPLSRRVLAWLGTICLVVTNIIAYWSIHDAYFGDDPKSLLSLMFGNMLTVPLGLVSALLLVKSWKNWYWVGFVVPLIFLILGVNLVLGG